MARTRNSATSARRRRATQPVTARTLARRARQQAARQEAEAAHRGERTKRDAPETIGQARVWSRKCHRYELAGLCDRCAATAAWGHAEGFGTLDKAGRLPCVTCQPLVNAFPHKGPRGSKWRKILDKLEYMDFDTLCAWLDEHEPVE